MMAIWYRLKFWWTDKKRIRDNDKMKRAMDPWSYEEDNK